MKKGKGRPINDEILEEIMGRSDPDALVREIARREKLDWVEFEHPSTHADNEHLVRVVRNPSHIRSPWAAYDPAHANSPDILKSLAMPAAGAGLASILQQYYGGSAPQQ